MNSTQIADLINEVAATPSLKEKQVILARHKDDEDLKQLLVMTYSPFITYGIKVNLEDYDGYVHDWHFDEGTFQLLDDLRYRRLTGNAAKEAIESEVQTLGKSSVVLLGRIINGDLRAGFSSSTINKVWPGLIPDPPYMRCTLPNKVKEAAFDWVEGVYSQTKADGMFSNCEHSILGEVRFTSRQGHEIPVTMLHDEVRATLRPGTVTMGELLVFKGGKVLPRKDSNGLINSLSENPNALDGHTVEFHAWDQIPIEYFVVGGRYEKPYMQRYASLFGQVASEQGKVRVIHTQIVHSPKEARLHAMRLQGEGGEGTVYKDPHAPWIDGTSPWQVKLKVEFVVDLKIIGYTQGKGKRAKDFGALICATSDDLLVTDVAGLKDADYARVHANREGYLGTIVAVAANDLSEVGEVAKLMHPRLSEFRADKVVADTLQQVRDQLEAAKNGGSA